MTNQTEREQNQKWAHEEGTHTNQVHNPDITPTRGAQDAGAGQGQ